MKQIINNIAAPFYTVVKRLHWLFYKITYPDIKLLLGAGYTKYKGWFVTNKLFLDVTIEKHFARLFSDKKISFVLAEHVIEHLKNDEIDLMIDNIIKYSDSNLNIRIAVPDGFNPDKSYIETVKPGGTGFGSDDHKHLFNYKSLCAVFEKHGLKSDLVEYWDEKGEFYSQYKNDEKGFILRSYINDPRKTEGSYKFTSLIIDFTK